MLDVDKAILRVLNLIKKNPLVIHSETDIQALLYAEIIKDEELENAESLYNTGHKLDGKYLKTNRVHCEYQGAKVDPNQKAKPLIDIVVFTKDSLNQINHSNRQLYLNEGWGKVPCEALIEIKFENGTKDSPEKVKDDFNKLRVTFDMHNKYNNIRPKLFLLYYFFTWNLTTSKKTRSLLEELPSLSQLGEKVNTYFLIGPKTIWEPIISKIEVNWEKIIMQYTL